MNSTACSETESDALAANVDDREVAFYDGLAAMWWDRAGPFWPLHRLNELRTRYVRGILARVFGRDANGEDPLAGLEILDVGCGGGILSVAVAGLGARVHGIDVVERNIAIAQHHVRDTGLPVRYEIATVSDLAAREVRYDVVLNMEVVEHVPDMQAFMRDCARLVRPGGVMVVATINRTALSWLIAIAGAEYVLRWLPRGTHRWSRFVKPIEIERQLEDFEVLNRIGVKVNPFNRKFSLTSFKAVNYMLLARRLPAPANPDPQDS